MMSATTTTTTPILIAMPRYVTIPRLVSASNNSATTTTTITMKPLLAPAKTVANIVPKTEPIDDVDIDPIDEFLVRGKKRRLDHLSWEEKFQRK